jgi:hypothetical protein
MQYSPPLSLLAVQWQKLTSGDARQLGDDLKVALRVLEAVIDDCQKMAYEDALKRLHGLNEWFLEPVGKFEMGLEATGESGNDEQSAGHEDEEAVNVWGADTTEATAVSEALRSLQSNDSKLDNRDLDRLLDRVAEGQKVLPESRPSDFKAIVTGGADW